MNALVITACFDAAGKRCGATTTRESDNIAALAAPSLGWWV